MPLEIRESLEGKPKVDNMAIIRMALSEKLNEEPPHYRTYKKNIKELLGLYPRWQENDKEGRANLTIMAVATWIQKIMGNQAESLLRIAANTLKRMNGDTLSDKLKVLRFVIRNASNKDDSSQNPVSLLSLHSSKGLEWDRVWLIGCEEDVLPHSDGVEEEERRLMYVGMTRARSGLIMSFREIGPRGPSRFLAESGLQHLLDQAREERSKREVAEQANQEQDDFLEYES